MRAFMRANRGRFTHPQAIDPPSQVRRRSKFSVSLAALHHQKIVTQQTRPSPVLQIRRRLLFTPRPTYPVILPDDEDSVFLYVDTAPLVPGLRR